LLLHFSVVPIIDYYYHPPLASAIAMTLIDKASSVPREISAAASAKNSPAMRE